MFDNIPHNDDEETSFSEAYRSEILNGGKEKEKTVLPKLISILLLMVVVSVMSIFGYNYFTRSSTKSSVVTETHQEKMSQDEERKKVKEIQKIEESSLPLPPPESMMIDNIEDLEIIEPAKVTTVEATPTATKSDNDFEQIANEMKLELSKALDKKSNTSVKKIESTPVAPPQTQKGEEIYMKQLRELSQEINREAI